MLIRVLLGFGGGDGGGVLGTIRASDGSWCTAGTMSVLEGRMNAWVGSDGSTAGATSLPEDTAPASGSSWRLSPPHNHPLGCPSGFTL